MYSASNAFHTAVASGNKQIALLIFQDAVFSNADIDVRGGMEMNDYFNAETDLSIGQTLSNELRFTIFNDTGLLNDYPFGEFLATVGVMISSETFKQKHEVYIESASNSYAIDNTAPYVLRNGTALATQPAYPIRNVVIYDGKVYCFGWNGYYIVYNDATGAVVSETLPAFTVSKFCALDNYGYFYNKNTRILTETHGDKKYTYEFVPWGIFTADRPKVPAVNRINFTCYDRMQKFDKDMPDKATLGLTYPTTISNLYVKMCNHLGVTYASSTFINSSATVDKEPDEFENATMRQVLGWIAETAASNAKFNRDGVLIFDWMHITGTTFTEHNYSEFNPYWYETPTINKLHNRETQSGTDSTSGSGDVGYLIQDNPLLKGAT